MGAGRASIVSQLPDSTVSWLTEPDNPVVSALFQRDFLGVPAKDKTLVELCGRRNDYEPVSRILGAMKPDGTWLPPERDYKKYEGNLWQIVFLGELWADPSDDRVKTAIEYAFSRQMPTGAWGPKPTPAAAAVCLTANVARGLARMGHAEDERVIGALAWIADQYDELGFIGCPTVCDFTINGYCHMCAPKYLLLLSEIREEAWPRGATTIRDASIDALRDKAVFRCLPKEYKRFQDEVWSQPRKEQAEARERFIKEHGPIEYRDKPGWLRFGFPLSYNSDALEAMLALAETGEPMRPEYQPALDAIREAFDDKMRCTMKNSLNGKMIADVEVKKQPSKWLTLRALTVLEHFGG